MKRKLIFTAFILMIISGCSKLDTSELKVSKPENEISEEQAKNIPITYEAPSMEIALEALPFDVHLPEELPFDSAPFNLPTIMDVNHDGRTIMLHFMTHDQNNEENILIIEADYPVTEYSVPNSEEVTLANNLTGSYAENTISFLVAEVNYGITYLNEDLTPEQRQEETIDLANQIINKK
ncbi:hypothetical protein [Cytobacillus purgationiresistens]|uniref:DUF4367 domain-containing protein n=1 Tax=Cytobacillus purgationiresistens TaxID=863449 RepID=A0ABU0AJD3_9BACI|nr:hypothetical protein [Cytobacillus purgationiresistens]MDQ0271377.1 hypothetical protein [Cytobacillus purgationiresistens]